MLTRGHFFGKYVDADLKTYYRKINWFAYALAYCTDISMLLLGGKLKRKERLSAGGLTGTLVDVRLIMKGALLCNATGMIISHNHPSGNENPSGEDNRITEQIKKAADTLNIRLLDHVIITSNTCYSYMDNGML